MQSKLVEYSDDARTLIKNGVDKLANAVKITLGPKGRHVLIRKNYGAPHITRDGVSIAREIFLKDQFEDMGAQMVKLAAQKTCDDAGDGTTSTTILAQEIYNQGLKLISAGHNPVDLKRGIDKAVNAVVEHLNTIKQLTVNKEEIAQVGTISANDKDIGDLIADAMSKIGKDGILTIEESNSSETTLSITDGIEFDRGYMTPYFITNVEKTIVELANPHILVCDCKLENINDIVELLTEISRSGRGVLIIADDYSEHVLTTLLQNKMKGALFSCPIRAPGYGERRKEILKDLSVLTGATLFSAELADIKKAKMEDLGSANKVVVSRRSTTIIDAGGNKEDIKARINQIKDDIENYETEYDKRMARERLAKLAGGIAIIKVGGHTETEIKEKKDRVEDAIHATKAAVEEGIVPGGGVALLRCLSAVEELMKSLPTEEKDGAKIIFNSIQAPFKMIAANAGKKGDVLLEKVLEMDGSNGYNAATDTFTDLVKDGVIDPTKVVRCSLENAASVASMLITTEAVVADDPTDVPPSLE